MLPPALTPCPGCGRPPRIMPFAGQVLMGCATPNCIVFREASAMGRGKEEAEAAWSNKAAPGGGLWLAANDRKWRA